MKILFEKIHKDAVLPQYMTEHAAGADICSCEELILEPGSVGLVKTGLKMAIEHGYEVQIRPRSGLALKNGLTVLNTPGTIDSDYRGEVGIILLNTGKTRFKVEKGMRIAQMVVSRVYQADFELCDSLDETARGAGGFGHTGA